MSVTSEAQPGMLSVGRGFIADEPMFDQMLRLKSAEVQGIPTAEKELLDFELQCDRFQNLAIDQVATKNTLVELWLCGAAILNEIDKWQARAADAHDHPYFARDFYDVLVRAKPRVTASMTKLASHWLRDQVPPEPRPLRDSRFADFRIPALNDRVSTLLPKNTEGTITPAEKTLLDRLVEFGMQLQMIITHAVLALPPRAP